MRYRRFGSTELTVSEIGLGCARIGGIFQTSRSGQLRLLDEALEAGITFFDTADMYAQGGSEQLLGEAFCRRRTKVVIASKVGFKFASRAGLNSRIRPVLKTLANTARLKRDQLPKVMRATVSEQDFSPGYITRMVEGTLKRLRSDYIDLYQLHSPPADVIQRGEFVPVMEELKRQGKIRYWGVACDRPQEAIMCLDYPGLSAIQISLSLLHPEALQAAIPLAAARGIAVIARQVFASGRLARPIDSNDEAADPQVAELSRAAREQRVELPALALHFALAPKSVSVALVGMHSPSHLPDLLAYAASAAKLSS